MTSGDGRNYPGLILELSWNYPGIIPVLSGRRPGELVLCHEMVISYTEKGKARGNSCIIGYPQEDTRCPQSPTIASLTFDFH